MVLWLLFVAARERIALQADPQAATRGCSTCILEQKQESARPVQGMGMNLKLNLDKTVNLLQLARIIQDSNYSLCITTFQIHRRQQTNKEKCF